jgi:hypothetical protein
MDRSCYFEGHQMSLPPFSTHKNGQAFAANKYQQEPALDVLART